MENCLVPHLGQGTSQRGWESKDALAGRLGGLLSIPGQWVTRAYFPQLPRCSHDAERKAEKRARMVARVGMVSAAHLGREVPHS